MVLKHNAQHGDLLCYGLYVHGATPIFQAIAYSRHAQVIAAQWEEHPHSATVAPPRHGKTTLMRWEYEQWLGMETEKTFTDPAYPTPTALYVMNTAGQVEDECQVIEYTLEHNKRYRQLFPHVKPAKQFGWTKSQFFLQRPVPRDTPSFVGCGMFGPIQGKGFRKLGMDDGTDQKDAGSPPVIEEQKRFRFGVFADRMDDENGTVRDILTRWHEKDIFSVLERISTVNSLVMPALGYWGPDEPLWPEVWGKKRLEAKRQETLDAGQAYLWPLTWLCSPQVATGDMYKRVWFVYGSPKRAEVAV